MLISSNRPAVSHNTFVRPPASDSNVTLLAPGDVYVPSEPNAVSAGASGAALGALAGGGLSLLANNFGLGGAALTVGLIVAGGIGGGYAAVKAFEASQK
jgi:hypothetical protein